MARLADEDIKAGSVYHGIRGKTRRVLEVVHYGAWFSKGPRTPGFARTAPPPEVCYVREGETVRRWCKLSAFKAWAVAEVEAE